MFCYGFKTPVKPTTAVLSGNPETVVAGRPLVLTCITGSSNPAASITWEHNHNVITNAAPVSETKGDNNGMVTTQTLTIQLTRSMDGDTYSCSGNNVAGTSSSSSTKLSLTCRFKVCYLKCLDS